jgi:hypothetical protein
MADKVVVNTGGMFLPLLAVLFIGLKLTGVIAWSWWWVLAPLWAPIAILLTWLLGGLLIAGVALGIAALVLWLADR